MTEPCFVKLADRAARIIAHQVTSIISAWPHQIDPGETDDITGTAEHVMERWQGPEDMHGDLAALVQYTNWMRPFEAALETHLRGVPSPAARTVTRETERVAYETALPLAEATGRELDELTSD